MESYSSMSSESPSGTLTTSSSSYDDGPRYSQIIIYPTDWCADHVSKRILVDLSRLDQRYNEVMGCRMLDPGFSYQGIYYPGDAVELEDGCVVRLQISRTRPLTDDAILKQWVDVMLGRIRGMMDDGRNEAQAVLGLDAWRWRII